MKKLYLKIVAAMLVVVFIWAQAESVLQQEGANFWLYRSAFVQLTGIITIILMVIVIALALRLPFVENISKGLDKSYQLHKWLGISALISAIIHWLFSTGPKYAVGWGLLARPQRNTPQLLDPDSLYNYIQPLRHSAESLGEWFFYAMLILGIIALVERIGYKFFRLSHKLMAVCFVVIAYHGAVLIKHAYWSYPITYITLVIIALGVAASIWSLLGKIGKSRSYKAVVNSFVNDSNNQVTDLRLTVQAWQGHQAGQFAYINFGKNNIHPFTIANQDNSNGQLRFLIKELGDFTSEFKYQLHKGQQINVEGPYGKFDFNDDNEQIWIAGGIGIAAFKAALQAQEKSRSCKKVTLYYCTLKPSPHLITELQQEANLANIELKVLDARTEPLLTVAQLCASHKTLKKCSIWFCGPVGFANNLKRDLKAIDFDLKQFHQEYFSMR